MQEDNEYADLAIPQLVSMDHTVHRIHRGKEWEINQEIIPNCSSL
jgi:hypothetical protein